MPRSTIRNRGFVCIGTSDDTPAFAADTIFAWRKTEGHRRLPGVDHRLLLADAGGSNGCQIRPWKERLQVQICDRFGLAVTVGHLSDGFLEWTRSTPAPCLARKRFCAMRRA